MATQQTALTQYAKAANGLTFAYRRLGLPTGIPLVMHTHFRANMDFWDPALVNPLAAVRPVILFDQAGTGISGGQIPRTYQGWAEDLIAFVRALGLQQIDLLGFSMGGRAVQMVALTAPQLVRKLILAGTSPSQPSSSSVAGIVWPRDKAPSKPIELLARASTPDEIELSLAFSFFYDDENGRAAAKAYWNRIHERNVSREPPLLDLVDRRTGTKNQIAAAREWDNPNPRNSFDRLGELKLPVLVLNGDEDLLIPTSHSWELLRGIENAQLIIYPNSGHGFLYQYAEQVATDINMFLDRKQISGTKLKL